VSGAQIPDSCENQISLSAAKSVSWKTIRFMFLFLAVPVGIPAGFIISNGFTSSEIEVDDQFGEIYPEDVDTSENSVNVWFQTTAFDPEGLTARMNIYPWPTNDLASPFSSSTILRETPVRIWVDELYGQSLYTFEADEPIGAINSQMDVLSIDHENRANDSIYPFDEYVLDTYVSTEISSDPSRKDQEFIPVKTFDFFYTNPLPGFEVNYQRKSAWNNELSGIHNRTTIESERTQGLISFTATYKRSSAVKAIALFVATFFLIGAMSLTWITVRIWSKRRPPSMQALVWAAATALGIIQLREILPGHPRIGIALDLIFFFPTLLVSLIATMFITVSWLRRDDFEI
jgi:hypothetical protein